jgi:hypothetical protein
MLQAGYEAWMDSGVEFNQLRGSKRVGVYVGATHSDATSIWLADIPNITGELPNTQWWCELDISWCGLLSHCILETHVCCMFVHQEVTLFLLHAGYEQTGGDTSMLANR